MGFPSGSDGEGSVCNAGDSGLIPVLGRSLGEGNGNTLQYSCLENSFHGQRIPEGYRPWRREESDMTEQLTLTWDVGSLTRNQTHTLCIRRGGLNHWTTREVLINCIQTKGSILLKLPQTTFKAISIIF